MDGLREYLFGVILAALICSTVTALTKGTAGKSLIRFLCGIYLAVTLLAPVSRVDPEAVIRELQPDLSGLQSQLDSAQAGAQEALRESIREKTEAYILDKAAGMDIHITVQVHLSEGSPPVPERVILQGECTPYLRLKLEQLIAQELGIPEEAQTWME